MSYIKVKWIHSTGDAPVWFYSELDADRWEIRKLEIYPDGSVGYAIGDEETGTTILSEDAIPPLEEIAKDSQFEPVEITKEEFEAIWESRLARRIR
jgi:hypothetical protein